MLKINALGDICPLPVVKAKKALKENSQILITVDNEIATQNLTKMATQLGLSIKIDQQADDVYHVYLGGNGEAVAIVETPQTNPNAYIVVINAKTMGTGDDKLGYALLKAFIYSLVEQDTLPSHILFYNGGVYLTAEGSEVLDDLNALATAGARIMSCGACLDFFALTAKLAVGEVTNMYRIVELMSQNHVVRP